MPHFPVGTNPIAGGGVEGEIELLGVPEVQNALDALGGRSLGDQNAAYHRIEKALVLRAAKICAAAEREEAPHGSGLLARAVGTSGLRTYAGRLFVTSGVRWGFRRAVQPVAHAAAKKGRPRALSKKATAAGAGTAFMDPARYGGTVQAGRDPIAAKNKKVLYSAASDRFFGQSVAAAAPDPFILRAFSRAKQEVPAMAAAEAPALVAAEVARLASH